MTKRDVQGHFVKDSRPESLDINNPEDGNKIVSPDNLHADPAVDTRENVTYN